MNTTTTTTTKKKCTCHKFIRLHDGDCDVHGRVRKQETDEDGQQAKIELINSDAGQCIAINDYRVAGPKPIHGVVVSEWAVDRNDILRAFLTPDQKHEWLSEELVVVPVRIVAALANREGEPE